MTAAQIRQKFLDFFASKQHTIVPSAPIVVKNDPTLLFTNAGMNQFKDYFLGNKKPPYNRVADTQKCLRVSGKHNDLEEVGVDTYHHTMFEMLGNWSLGDPDNEAAGYFKNEAIAWSWELLTEVYQLDKDRLYVSVFEGDEKENLPPSKIALAAWRKLVPEDHIIFGNKKDNFWEMGDTGPCGPCSEIHVDCRSDEERKKIPGRELVNKDHPQVIEIWNNVFIQYNRKKDGTLELLKAKHVDTGMGLERLVRVLQNKQSNYDTDLFSGTIAATENITGKKYSAGDDKQSVAFRVIADHIRAISFTIADGQLPANTGAGYVIRRILRRAVRYYYSYLDYKSPLLHSLVPLLATQFENVFPELKQQEAFVAKVIREEEEAFLRTLDKGLKRIADSLKAAASTGSINGKDAFELYDTYGFPIDLTRLIATENKLTVDEAGFEEEMLQQKNRSRAATAIDAGDWIEVNAGNVAFVGYDTLEVKTKLLKYRTVSMKGKTTYQLVLEQSPFYAESGGQIGDKGTIQIGGKKIAILDTKKENDLIILYADQLPNNPNEEVYAAVDANNRKKITLHHSATHLLHAALRTVLGTHVAQKGSLVNAEQLRFDFSHFSKMTDEEIARVEQLVNQKIRENHPVVIKTMSKEEAIAMGAMALFGEKYGDKVRVVIIDPAYSIELCGGTHAGSTGELGMFKLIVESAVAAGVRRVEAVSGEGAEQYVNDQLQQLHAVKELVKNTKDPLQAIQNLQEELSQWKKKAEQLENQILIAIRNELVPKAKSINHISFIGETVELSSVDAVKKLALDINHQLSNSVVVLCANVGGKASVAIAISDELVKEKNLDAGKLIKEIAAPLIKGGGGGQKTLATAGGQDASQFEQVIKMIEAVIG
ncbi:MAG: alanine--tRNA ligase [Bacteroidetes bacterium]|nr:alanine--tRNA ligase [Bacteroidota bacterium]